MSFDDAKWMQWPADRPRPTEEEYAAAQKRWAAEADEAFKNGCTSDFLCGLSFVMATYARPCWWHFFYPAEKKTFNPQTLQWES